MTIRDDSSRQIGAENGLFCPVVDFHTEPEAETLVPISQAASALVVILHWLTRSQDFAFTGAKVAALAALLDPVNSEYRNMSQVARAAKISRATLSKAVLNLRDTNGIRFAGGKRDSARDAYRETQLKLVALGRHASQRRNTKNDVVFHMEQ